jgi:hypothetical protein
VNLVDRVKCVEGNASARHAKKIGNGSSKEREIGTRYKNLQYLRVFHGARPLWEHLEDHD